MPQYQDLGDNRIRITFNSLDAGISRAVYGGAEGQIAACRDVDLYTSPGQIRSARQISITPVAGPGGITAISAYAVYQSTNADNSKNFLVWSNNVSGSPGTYQTVMKSSSGDLGTTLTTVATAASASGLSMATSATPFLFMMNKPIEFSGSLYWPSWISANSNYALSTIVNDTTGYDQFKFATGGGYTNFVGPVAYKEYFYYANGNVLYRNDGTTETATLTLQTHLDIKSITIVNLDGNDWLGLAVDYKNGSGNSFVYIYDGISTFLRQIIDTNAIGIQSVRQLRNSLVTIHVDNPYGGGNNDAQDNYLRIKTWDGGGRFNEVYSLLLKVGFRNQPFFVRDAATVVVNDGIIFGLDGATNSPTSGDTAAMYEFRLPNILNEKYIVNTGTITDQLDFKNIAYIRNFLYSFFVNNTTNANNFSTDQSGSYSGNCMIRTLPFRFDIRHPAVIKLIEGQVKAMPVGTNISAVHYPNQGVSALIGVVNATSQRTFRFTNENTAEFPISDIDQIEFRIPGINTTTRPELIMPFIVEAEIRKSN